MFILYLSFPEKQPFWKKALCLKSNYTTAFSGPVYAKYSKLQVKDHVYTIHQLYGASNLCFQKHLKPIQITQNSSAREFLTI